MTLDLAQLRRLADGSARHALFWKPVAGSSSGSIREMDVDAYDAWCDAAQAFRNAVTPTVVLELLDRLERAEERLTNARAHWRITAGTTYGMSGMGRILGEEGE